MMIPTRSPSARRRRFALNPKTPVYRAMSLLCFRLTQVTNFHLIFHSIRFKFRLVLESPQAGYMSEEGEPMDQIQSRMKSFLRQTMKYFVF